MEHIKTAISDLETTSIEYDDGGRMIIPHTVHLIAIYDLERGISKAFGPSREALEEAVQILNDAELVVFHNGIGFDLKVMKHHFGFEPKHDLHVVDSMLILKLFYSNQKEEDFRLEEKHRTRPITDPYKFTGKMIGSHSLEAWGLRLNSPQKKISFYDDMKHIMDDPFSMWTPEMELYGIQDVVTLAAIWSEKIAKRFHDPKNRNALLVEHYVAELMEQVKESGIKLDVEWAKQLAGDLEKRQEELRDAIREDFPPRYEPVKWVFKPIPLGMPDLSDELREEYARLSSDPSMEAQARCQEIIETNGPLQKLTMLMVQNDSDIYRPRFNLPEGYLREQWGEVTHPKVNRVARAKDKSVLYEAKVGCPFVKMELTEFNPGSRVQIIRRLLDLGWVPEEFTDTGRPSTSEVELNKIADEIPAAANLAKYLLIDKRLGQIKNGDKAWLNLVSSEGFVHPSIRSCDTLAFRASHADPNISQVPSVKAKDLLDADGNKVLDGNGKVVQRVLKGEEGKWGWDCRKCFTVPPGFVMVGSDLAGIEMRAWAHHLWQYDDGLFADIVLNRDVHEENRIILGFDDRRMAKSFLYALMYGGGDEKLGFIIDPMASIARQKELGAAARARFMHGLRGYEQLHKKLLQGVRLGYVLGLDGRRVPVRKPHAALNSLLQSDGAVISKYWIMFCIDILENEHNLSWGYDKDYTLLIYSHDELQFAARDHLKDVVLEACERSAKMAGEFLKFKLPVEVGLMHGAHWGDTH